MCIRDSYGEQAAPAAAAAADPYAAMDAATDPYAAVPDAGTYDPYAAQDAAAAPMDAGEAYDPYAAAPPPPSSSYLDQWKNKRKNIFDDNAMNS